MEAARSAASFIDGRGEAGQAEGILNGSDIVAASLQLCSNSSGLLCKEQQNAYSRIFHCLDGAFPDVLLIGLFSLIVPQNRIFFQN